MTTARGRAVPTKADQPAAAPAFSFAPVTIADEDFEAFRRLIHAHTGIALAPCKRYLVQARLAKRLRELHLDDFGAYHRLLADDTSGSELRLFINAMTTNKTDFFREAHHFEFLRDRWLPERRLSSERRVRIWSAACSTGEEPYTLAVTVLDALGGATTGWDVRILATDIDTDVLARATAGVYSLDAASRIPAPLLARYFQRGTGAGAGTVRVGAAARNLVTFRHLSLLDDPWPMRSRFDAVFCRNVLIYFDRPTQERVLARLVGQLHGDGLLFLGHSESAHGLVGGVRPVGPTIYQRTEGASCALPPRR